MSDEKSAAGKITSTILKVVAGLVLVTLGLWAIIGWWSSLAVVFKGCIGLFLVLAGLIIIAIAKE